jgi:hypothetical protein
MRTRIGSLFFSLALALTFGTSAQAAPVDVTYAISVSIDIPAFATTAFSGTGDLTVRFQNGTPGSHASPGPITVLGGNAFVAGTFSLVGDLFSGFQNIVWAGGGSGSATGAGAFNLSTVGLIASGQIHCTGATCAIASLPASVPVPLTGGTVPFAGAGTLYGFPSVGPQSFVASGPAGTFGGISLSATVTGVEISRVHQVPEPTSASMIGLGLLAAAALGGAARKLRR